MGNGNSQAQIPHQPSEPQVLKGLHDQNYNFRLSEPIQSDRPIYLTSAFNGVPLFK